MQESPADLTELAARGAPLRDEAAFLARVVRQLRDVAIAAHVAATKDRSSSCPASF
jgi:hypothetical protein